MRHLPFNKVPLSFFYLGVVRFVFISVDETNPYERSAICEILASVSAHPVQIFR